MTDRWTAETEELGTAALRRHGQLGEAYDATAVRAVLTALADAGLLLPPGGEWREVWYQRRVKALGALLAHYRVGSQPPEKLHRELEVTGNRIDKDGAWVAVNET